MIVKKSQKIPTFFCCKKTNHKMVSKKDYNKLLLTLKHKMIVKDCKKSQKIPFIRNYGHINLRNHIIMIHVLS